MDHRELLFLQALRTTDVLDAILKHTGTAEGLAAHTSLTPETATFVLEALADLGYLASVNETYEPTNELLGFLTKTDIRSIGRLPAALDEADHLIALAETLQGGEPPGIDEEVRVNALGAAAAIDQGRIQAVAAAIRKATPTQSDAILIAGAPGRLAVELADRGLTVTVADRPLAIQQSTGVLAGSSVQTLRTDDWSDLPQMELVVIAPGIRIEPTPWKPLVSVGSNVVGPGGRLVVIDRFHEPGTGDPLTNIREMATLGRTIDRAIPTVRSSLAEEGLTVGETIAIPETDFVGVTARQARD